MATLTWGLRDHLSGHVTRAATSCFEKALSSYVKDRVQRQYPDERSSLDNDGAVEKTVADLRQEVAGLDKLIKEFKSLEKNKQQEWTGESIKVMGLKKKDAEKKLRQKSEKPGAKKVGAKKKVLKEQPVELLYILECRWI
jgi:hypothetical protein